ncbi:reverse transcriptase domain-containing protein [Tanacetum coccineum]|uniref:Reverse transcriptase domain-containing protein n=1 Tax=Tanacetum coccineum TaxID=301880 RepID=A0ABQ4Y5N0_9ASTR
MDRGRRGSVPKDEEIVSAVLLTKRDGRQKPIHYVSRSLQGAETNYASMEKLTLALVHTARRLRRVAVKGQVLADFLADSLIEINATPERLYTDGASNNEGSRAGLILIAPDDMEYSYVLCLNFSNSNNDVEYEALLAGLRIATEMQVKDINSFLDSKLVASQVEGSYEAKGERMIKYQEKVLELAGAFNRFRITHIPRAENKKANALSKLAAVQFDHLSKEVLVEVLNECSVKVQEKGVLPEDPVGARTLMEKIGNYTIEDGVLYRKSYLVPLMRLGIPAAVIIDNGTQFVTDPFKKWAEKLKIQLISTLVYHPQGNGAVERANRSLLRGIKTRLEKGRISLG